MEAAFFVPKAVIVSEVDFLRLLVASFWSDICLSAAFLLSLIKTFIFPYSLAKLVDLSLIAASSVNLACSIVVISVSWDSIRPMSVFYCAVRLTSEEWSVLRLD